MNKEHDIKRLGRPPTRPLAMDGGLAVGQSKVIPLHQTQALFRHMSELRKLNKIFDYEISENGVKVWREA